VAVSQARTDICAIPDKALHLGDLVGAAPGRNDDQTGRKKELGKKAHAAAGTGLRERETGTVGVETRP
jgi:hypothetical protein